MLGCHRKAFIVNRLSHLSIESASSLVVAIKSKRRHLLTRAKITRDGSSMTKGKAHNMSDEEKEIDIESEEVDS